MSHTKKKKKFSFLSLNCIAYPIIDFLQLNSHNFLYHEDSKHTTKSLRRRRMIQAGFWGIWRLILASGMSGSTFFFVPFLFFFVNRGGYGMRSAICALDCGWICVFPGRTLTLPHVSMAKSTLRYSHRRKKANKKKTLKKKNVWNFVKWFTSLLWASKTSIEWKNIPPDLHERETIRLWTENCWYLE